MPSEADNPGIAGRIDPVLAVLDALARYRRSWRCWLIGGPAAVDDVEIEPGAECAGVRLVVRLREGAFPSWEPHWQVSLVGTPGRRCPECAGSGSVGAGDPYRRPAECPVCRGAGRLAPPGYYILTRELVPEDAQGRRLLRAFRRAWQKPDNHVLVRAGTSGELCRQVEAAGVLDEGLAAQLRSACRLAELRTRGGPLDPVACVEYEARLARASRARLSLAGDSGLCWVVGSGTDTRVPAVGLKSPIVKVLSLASLAPIAIWLLLSSGDTLLNIYWSGYLLYMTFGTRDARALWGGLCQRLRRFRRHLAEGRHAEGTSTIVVVGPHAAASARLFSLFAHLAGHAQLTDPGQGGTVLDSTYADLSPLLDPYAPAPTASSTYRMELGDALPGPRRLRLVHLVPGPAGLSDAQCRRALARASQVWLVVPAASAKAPDWAQEIASAAPDARVLLLGDTMGNQPAGVECRQLDLAALCERYQRGGVSPEEAARLVRGLVGCDLSHLSHLSSALALAEAPRGATQPPYALPPRVHGRRP